MATVVAWTDNWNSSYPTVNLTEDRYKALVERVKKRQYNFSYQMFMMPYTTPVFNDYVKCEITKSQWDKVLADAYNEQPLPNRCIPMDVLTIKKNDTLWEKEKFVPGDE